MNIAAFTVNFLVACTPKDGTSHARVMPVAGQNQPAKNAPLADGTSDSGGGTGIDKKVFESYIIDPTELPAFQKFVKPLLQNIKASDPKNPNKYDRIFKMKTWYLAPVELDKIKNNLLGVSFIKSETQQIARQTMKEVWIDKRIFEKMTMQDQAELLIHEFVMGQYFLRFMSIKDLCKISIMLEGEKNNQGCLKVPDFIEKSMPPEKPRQLTEEDNENIRFVTGWFLQHAQNPIAEEDYVRILFYKGFDKRFFNPASHAKQKDKPSDLKMTYKTLLETINAAKLTGFMPEICTDSSGNTSESCKVEVTEKNLKYKNFLVPGISLKITSSKGEAFGALNSIIGDQFSLPASQDRNGNTYYILTLTDWHETMIVGNHVFTGFLLFRQPEVLGQQELILESIVLRQGVITSIDKKRDPICHIEPLKIINPFDGGVVVHREKSDSLLTEQIFLSAPPFSMCNQDNVGE
jgi:hypothetical protein